jgi:dTDP-glucose 4,6-dehydratase
MIFMTGGAGFIGSNFVLNWLAQHDEPVLNLDKLTYAGNPNNLSALKNNPSHIFVQGDIGDADLVSKLLLSHRPRAIVHFAAESHVDRSIHDPTVFVETNIKGTFSLLAEAMKFWTAASAEEKMGFRFLHVSTDEVFGSLEKDAPSFSEETAYAPNSPYSASKAASDHLVRAYHHTYGLPTLTVNSSNSYGPYHFPEKLIPLMISNALNNKSLPIYGDGQQSRDWMYVDDHCAAITKVLKAGTPGETYNIGGRSEKTNLEVVHTICDILDTIVPKKTGSYRDQIIHVADRPGHDRRYAINTEKIQRKLGWNPVETFDSGIRKTIQWYLENPAWMHSV